MKSAIFSNISILRKYINRNMKLRQGKKETEHICEDTTIYLENAHLRR
ncbi:hypothetical protein JOC33_000075 [Thalassobacillus pellis]|nr:hypothetical protein [Thalassobacillus pellis]